MLWVIIAVMTAVALAVLLPPLLRRREEESGRAAFDMEVYRDQIAEIGRDLERGLISAREAEDARAEIGRRLLAADRRREAEDAGRDADRPAGWPRRAHLTAAAIAAGVPLAAIALYLAVGSPLMTGPREAAPAVAGVEGAAGGADMAALVDELGRKLRDRPDDARGWALYARSLTSLGRIDEGITAYRRAIALDPKSAELLSRFAEALILAAKGTVTPQARGVLDDVIALDPKEPRASYYIGLAAYQAGRRPEALDHWLAMEGESPPDAPWRAVLADRIDRLAKELGITDEALAAMRGTTARRPAPDETGAMIHAMVARLAERLKEQPDDAEGWQRLARSYRVLGETAKARDALKRAARLLPDDLAVQADYAAAIMRATERNAALPDELSRVLSEILKREPDHPGALWLSGIARLDAGDQEAALVHWRRLQGLLEPGTRQYEDVTRRIESLRAPAKP